MSPLSNHGAVRPFYWSPNEASDSLQRWKRLLPWFGPVRIRPRSTVFLEGGRSEYVYLLESGLIKIGTVSSEGTENVIGLILPGQIVEWQIGPTSGLHTFSAVAVTDVALLRTSVAEFRSCAYQSSEANEFFLENLLCALTLQSCVLAEMKTLRPEIRLERLLRQIASFLGTATRDGAIRVRIPFTEDELAQILGLSPRHVSRLKSSLALKGRAVRLSRQWFWLHPFSTI